MHAVRASNRNSNSCASLSIARHCALLFCVRRQRHRGCRAIIRARHMATRRALAASEEDTLFPTHVPFSFLLLSFFSGALFLRRSSRRLHRTAHLLPRPLFTCSERWRPLRSRCTHTHTLNVFTRRIASAAPLSAIKHPLFFLIFSMCTDIGPEGINSINARQVTKVYPSFERASLASLASLVSLAARDAHLPDGNSPSGERPRKGYAKVTLRRFDRSSSTQPNVCPIRALRASAINLLRRC